MNASYGDSQVVEVEIANEQSLDLEELQQVTAVYRERHSVLTLIRMLNHLVNAIQRHRGVSLAHLAGDKLFMEDVSLVQNQVNKRLWVMRHSCDHYAILVPEQTQKNIQHSWDTVCHDWQDDALLENFEYHSFLVDQLLQLSSDLARRLGEPVVGRGALAEAATPRHNHLLSDWILALVSRGVPQLIEYLAKIRGIATHSAVVGGCDPEQDKKLRYWLQCAEQESRDLVRQIDAMDDTVRTGWRSLEELKNNELKLAFFLNTVSRDILHANGAGLDARSLFALGSELISVYVEGVDGGIGLLQSGLENEFERWLQCEQASAVNRWSPAAAPQ